MGEIINLNNSIKPIENNDKVVRSESDLIALTEDILLDTRADISNQVSLSRGC